LRGSRAFSSDAKSATSGSRSGAVIIHDVIGERDRVIARDVNPVPLRRGNRIVDDVMRSAVGVDEAQIIATVRVKQIVDDQRTGVAAINRNAAVT
jgi:hypothetical protein